MKLVDVLEFFTLSLRLTINHKIQKSCRILILFTATDENSMNSGYIPLFGSCPVTGNLEVRNGTLLVIRVP